MSDVVSLIRCRPTAQPVPTSLMPLAPGDRILRMPELMSRVGLSPATLYRRIAREQFPAQVSLGGKSVGWRESEINAWIAARGQDGAV